MTPSSCATSSPASLPSPTRSTGYPASSRPCRRSSGRPTTPACSTTGSADATGWSSCAWLGQCGYPRPIVVLTGHGAHEVDEEALAAGAADFLSKAGITGPAIDRSLRYAIRHRQTLEALRASERERRRLSVELLTAQEKERRAVAREIHDSIGQILAAATYVLESALVQRPADRSTATEALIGRVVGMLRQVIQEASRIQLGLQPAMLDSAGIGPTLSWFCGEFSRTYGIRVEPRIEVDEEAVPLPLKATLFRIVQEAFRNAARHSGADTVLLELAAGPQAISLIIEDRGRGFEEQAAGRADVTGGGLANMRERALLSGGTFDLEDEAREGNAPRVRWPDRRRLTPYFTSWCSMA